MCAPVDSREKLEWLSSSSKIRKAVDKSRVTNGRNERIKFDKLTYRQTSYFTDLDT